MFRQITNKFKPRCSLLFAVPKQRFTIIHQLIPPKRKSRLPIVFGSACTLALCYFFFLRERFDDIEEIQEKTKSFGTLDEEKTTIEYLNKHLEYYTEREGENSEEVAIILMLLAHHSFFASEDKLQAIEYGERSCQILFELNNMPVLIDQLDDLTEMARQASPGRASRFAEESIKFQRELAGDKPIALVHLGLSRFFKGQNDLAKANKYLDKVKIWLNSLRKLNEDSEQVNYEACNDFNSCERYEESHVFCQKEIQYLQSNRNIGKYISQFDQEKEYRAYQKLAENALKLGKIEESLKFSKTADELLENWPEKSEDYYLGKAHTHYNIGYLYFLKKDYDQAIINWNQAQHLSEQVKQDRNLLEMLFDLKLHAAIAHLQKNKDQKGFELVEESLEFGKSKLGSDHPSVKNPYVRDLNNPSNSLLLDEFIAKIKREF